MHTRRFFACVTLAMAVVIGAASTASASGGSAYQIAFSNNCNNPSVVACEPPPVSFCLGGDWGSVRLNSDATGTAQFTTANHQTPGIPTGATHFSLGGGESSRQGGPDVERPPMIHTAQHATPSGNRVLRVRLTCQRSAEYRGDDRGQREGV